MRVLLTGFQPFGELQVNPSQLIVEHYQSQPQPDLIPLILPTKYRASGELIEAALLKHQPDAYIALGVAQSRTTISLERIAVNVDDASLADNAGHTARGERIAEDGPAAYWSTLPLDAMRAVLDANRIPVSISNHAGTYICNHTFYAARHALERSGRAIPCGFIHIPDLLKPNDPQSRGLPLDVMIKAVDLCLDVVRASLAEKSPASV